MKTPPYDGLKPYPSPPYTKLYRYAEYWRLLGNPENTNGLGVIAANLPSTAEIPLGSGAVDYDKDSYLTDI